jgi:ATP-dependent DNA helicase RecG
MPVPGSALSDLDKRRLEEYLVRIAGDKRAPHNDEEWITRISNLDLLKKSQFGEFLCTIAGIILFGNQPVRKYPYAGIRVLVFPGSDKDYNATRDDWISRPIVEFNDYDEKNNAISIEPNIVEQAISLLREHISSEVLDGATRKRIWDYPADVLRELLVNALAHRDYTKAVEIEVGVYNNRLEVISPGAPPNGQTKEKMLAGQRIARNPIIAEIMRDYGLGENRGMGIRRKIIPLMVQHNGVEPIFDITDDFVKVTLPKKAQSS